MYNNNEENTYDLLTWISGKIKAEMIKKGVCRVYFYSEFDSVQSEFEQKSTVTDIEFG